MSVLQALVSGISGGSIAVVNGAIRVHNTNLTAVLRQLKIVQHIRHRRRIKVYPMLAHLGEALRRRCGRNKVNIGGSKAIGFTPLG